MTEVSDKEFTEAVTRALIKHGSEKLATRFEVWPYTIRAWANGSARPHPGVKKYVFESLRKDT